MQLQPFYYLHIETKSHPYSWPRLCRKVQKDSINNVIEDKNYILLFLLIIQEFSNMNITINITFQMKITESTSDPASKFTDE